MASEGRALSLAELSARLGLPKASAHRICTLREGDWLMRDADERAFSVGPALRRLALDTLNNGVVRGLRHRCWLSWWRIGETCNFTTLDGAIGALYLDRVEAQWPWRLTLDVARMCRCTAPRAASCSSPR